MSAQCVWRCEVGRLGSAAGALGRTGQAHPLAVLRHTYMRPLTVNVVNSGTTAGTVPCFSASADSWPMVTPPSTVASLLFGSTRRMFPSELMSTEWHLAFHARFPI